MSTLALCAHIVLPATSGRGQVELRKVSEVSIDTSVHDLCQRATVTLPRHVSQMDQEKLKTYIRRGDAIKVYLGYNDDLELEFEGYVERLGSETPVVIELRDGLFKLLQEPFNKSYASCHVPTLVKDLVGETFTIQALDATIGPVRFEKSTKAAAFKALRDEFGLVTYLKGGTLFCGELFDADARTATYDQERNMRSSNLKYRVADDVKLKVTAKSIKVNGDDFEVTVGDEAGEQRSLTYYGIATEEELKKLATADMEKFRYDGYEGDFAAFGIPLCQYGDKVQLRSTQFPERDSDTVAEGVHVSFGPGGFARTIKLAQQWTR